MQKAVATDETRMKHGFEARKKQALADRDASKPAGVPARMQAGIL